MPEILSRFLKASAAAVPMILAVNTSAIGQDAADLAQSFEPPALPFDANLLTEASAALFGDMQDVYNVPDDSLGRYTSEMFDQDFLERTFIREQQDWQKRLADYHPGMTPEAAFIKMKADDLFLAQTLVAATGDYEASLGRETDSRSYEITHAQPLSLNDQISHFIGLFAKPGLAEDKLRNPFGFFNLAETDSLSMKTPYISVTAEQLAPFRTLAEGEDAPTILMLPPTPKKSEVFKDPAKQDNLNYETQAQWQAGYDILTGLGANVIVLDADQTEGGVRVSGDLELFVRDEALVFPDAKVAFYPWQAIKHGLNKSDDILEGPYEPTGQPVFDVIHEMTSGPYREILASQGFELIPIKSSTLGGDFQVHPTLKFALMADNAEDNKDETVRILEEKTGYDVLLVPKIRNGTYYHLDTFAMILPHGEVMIYPRATTEQFMEDLEARVGAENIIRIGPEDAQAAVTNLMSVGDTLVMPAGSAELRAELQERGYAVFTPAAFPENHISFYSHQRGYLHCETQELSFSP